MEDEVEEILGQSADKEIKKVKDEERRMFFYAQTKYENISKLLIGLASGALVLSVPLLEKLTKGVTLSCWGKSALLFSWIAFIVSIFFGLYILWNIYKSYRNLASDIERIRREAEDHIEENEQQSHGRLTFEGSLEKLMHELTQVNIKEWYVWIQFIGFGIGVSLLFITGLLNLI